MMEQNFLVEIGTEELPPKSLRSLAESFAKNFRNQLNLINIQYNEVLWYASPRRLALKVINLAKYQNDRQVKNRGPAINQAFDSKGNPTQAAKRWAHNCGINLNQAKRLITDKGEYLFYFSVVKGNDTRILLLDIVINSLRQLHISKLMRWGNKDAPFIRPVHTLIMLFGDNLIDGELFGVQSSRVIYGHRFIGESKIIVTSAEQYPAILYERGKVIADYEDRKKLIKHEINKIAQKLGGIALFTDSLLEEVTSLVEWPVVLHGKFENKFLSIPKEVIIHTMKYDQKYFPIYDHFGNLMSDFIFVANIESVNPKEIIIGNEKVMRPRLVDAEFFYKYDRKKCLEDYLPELETIVFQEKLGTLRDKTDRLKVLTQWISSKVGAYVNHSVRAALLSKCDLVTNMVFEFPSIQGIIGMHYALLDGEFNDVAVAIKEHYQPRFSGDKLPSNLIAVTLALADKIDTLVGIIGIGQHPKGNKDPFALRRIAFGLLRIIIEKGYDLDLLSLTQQTVYFYGNKLSNKNVINDVIEFMFKRFLSFYKEKGYRIDTIQSVLAMKPTKPLDFDARVKAITFFRTLEVSEALIISNKRIANILNQANEKLNKNIITSMLILPEEVNLASRVMILQTKLESFFANKKYKSALIELAALRGVIDDFFDNVMIMDSKQILRINRLTLLNQLYSLFLRIGNISLLH
ncbi:glycine--tRNA ligase subunit beta [Arsenophonus endosymbiont of Lipoptena cervi]|uniref:glycine--tRNA ligase subunit beta n=1 Tax=Arsenophonus endosymbiont of Lipoptena cervi TaxID=363258 RepID=UPI00376F3738